MKSLLDHGKLRSEARNACAAQLKCIARSGHGRALIANTSKLAQLAVLLVDADTCEQVVGIILNLSYPSETDCTVRNALVDGGNV